MDASEASVGQAEADELRALLEEAEAARAELASKTDELGRRIAELEALVIGVSDALAELRPVAPDQVDGNRAKVTTGRPRARSALARVRKRPRARASA